MSTSVLYRALGLRGYEHRSIREQGGGLLMHVQPARPVACCSQCQGRNIVHRGTVPRSWLAPPIGRQPVTVFADVPRVECRDCRSQPVVPVPFADPRRSYTRSFERLVLDLRRRMTIQDVARHLCVSEWIVKDIDKRWLGRRFSRPKLRHVKRIAIDEIAVRKGHRYLTIVLDLDSGAVVFVGKGNGAEALKPFWKRRKAARAKVQAVAMDMSAAYCQAVSKHLPRTAVVFDWFHVVKLLNDKLSELRRELYREATDQLHKRVLKGTRWLLLKRPEHLDDDRGERRRLEEALKLNQSLATA
jgi:transposase